MALDTTLSSHVDVPSDNEATNTIPTSLISFKKGAGPGSYYYFESNPNAKLHKTRACECQPTKLLTPLCDKTPDPLDTRYSDGGRA